MNQPFVERRKMAITPALMTEEEVARRLNVSVASLRRWRLLKKGPVFIKIGPLVRYRPEDLDSWLSALPKGGNSDPSSESDWPMQR
jgi:Helix-turn-helix domain